MKFYCEITSWGEEALHFLDDPNANFIVIFDNNAPAELAEFSVLHTTANYNEDPAVGDTMIICDKAFDITAAHAASDRSLHAVLQGRNDTGATRLHHARGGYSADGCGFQNGRDHRGLLIPSFTTFRGLPHGQPLFYTVE